MQLVQVPQLPDGFCWICLRKDCEVVRTHGSCPQGKADPEQIKRDIEAMMNGDSLASGKVVGSADDREKARKEALAKVEALKNYAPDENERLREQHWQQHGTGPPAVTASWTRRGRSEADATR